MPLNLLGMSTKDRYPTGQHSTPWELEGYISYKDTRPGVPSTKKMDTEIPLGMIRQVVLGSLHRGLDPYTSIAQLIQESNAGRWDDPFNPLHVSIRNAKKEAEVTGTNPTDLPKDMIDAALNYMALLKRRYTDQPDKALQAYQGLGWLVPGRDKWPGPLQKASETMPYVKRIRAIKNTFKDNPQLLEVVRETRELYKRPEDILK